MKFSVVFIKQAGGGIADPIFFVENQPIIFHSLTLIGQKFGVGSVFE